MLTFVIRRLMWLPVLLLMVTAVTFLLGTYGPGDPVQVMMGSRYDPDVAERLRENLGLNRPLVVQYFDYVINISQGDFGESLRFRGRSVSSLLISKMWVSFQVNIVAISVSLIIGIPLGFGLLIGKGLG